MNALNPMATRRRPLVFGEILFDRFPDGSAVLGGAPLNVAWNLRGLGFDPLLVTRVGDDALGERITNALTQQGIDTTGVEIDPHHPTGTVEVTIDQGQPQFEIMPDCAYDHIESPDSLNLSSVELLYCGSLALRNRDSLESFERLFSRAEQRLFVDVNLRAPWWRRELVSSLLDRASLAKLNDDELIQLSSPEASLDESATTVRARYDLDLLCVTRGAAGATCWTGSGDCYSAKPEPDARVVDTVGAGDAFSSVLIAGDLCDWPLDVTMERALNLATAVVGLRGATSPNAEFYQFFRHSWSLE